MARAIFVELQEKTRMARAPRRTHVGLIDAISRAQRGFRTLARGVDVGDDPSDVHTGEGRNRKCVRDLIIKPSSCWPSGSSQYI